LRDLNDASVGVPERRQSDSNPLLSLPWWLGIVVGLFAYGVVGWLLPLLLANEATRADVAATMQVPALLALGVCLTLSAVIAWNVRHRCARFAVRNGLSDLRRCGTREFTGKVATAFERRGYAVDSKRVRGIDLVVLKDGRRYFVRCKQWKVFNVDLKPLVELHTLMNREAASGGFFVSAGVFTRHARVYAAEMNIELIGGTSLLGFLETDAEPTAPTVFREPVFASNTALTIPVCPYCGNPMVRRTEKYGKNAGEEFWGCGQYPHCRGTR
jgi:restriction system protein